MYYNWYRLLCRETLRRRTVRREFDISRTLCRETLRRQTVRREFDISRTPCREDIMSGESNYQKIVLHSITGLEIGLATCDSNHVLPLNK